MQTQCAYSFLDLYQAAFGIDFHNFDSIKFSGLSQSKKNEKVRQWAALAGWQTLDRIGSDGQLYVAFAPKMPYGNYTDTGII